MCIACRVTASMSDVEARNLPPRTEWFWAEMELLRHHHGLAGHPFLDAWQQGAVTRNVLKRFANEHHSLVVVLACCTRAAADRTDGLLRNGLELAVSHAVADVDRWRRFADVTGWRCCEAALGVDVSAETAMAKTALAPLPEHTLGQILVTIWALAGCQLETVPGQPAALLKHYGLDADGTAWFDHRRWAREVVPFVEVATELQLEHEDPLALLTHAKTSLEATRFLFDGLDRAQRTLFRIPTPTSKEPIAR